MSVRHTDLESTLASVLQLGTWSASALIALGWLTSLANFKASNYVMSLGILLLVILPIIRLCFMVHGFAKERDYRLAGIATSVLAIIAVSFMVGLSLSAKH